jgi:hypothetical protein
MIKKHTGANKLVSEFMGGDPMPTWEDKLKNQMGYGQMSDLARSVHGKGNKTGPEDAEQLLSDLGKKSSTIAGRTEAAVGGKKVL